jgi:hypothetical protein
MLRYIIKKEITASPKLEEEEEEEVEEMVGSWNDNVS